MDATLTPDKMWELAAVKARWDDFEPAFVLIDQLSETQIQLPEHRKQDLKKIEEHAQRRIDWLNEFINLSAKLRQQ